MFALTLSPIIVFSGLPQTGKTAIAKRLANALHWKFLSFGDFVRQQARARGTVEPTRRELQDLGQKMVEMDVISFCREALNNADFSPGEPLVIDGIRHMQALEAVKVLSRGQPVRLIYLQAPIKTREARSSSRGESDLSRVDAHKVESQTNVEILRSADLVVDSSGNPDQVFEYINSWLVDTCGVPRTWSQHPKVG